MTLLRFDKESEQWNIIDRKQKKQGDLMLAQRLLDKLDFAKRQIKKDHDAGGLVAGAEGSGKSTLAANIMRYMTDDRFDPLKHIIKDYEESLIILKNAPRGAGVMFDEGYLLFSSTEVMMRKQRDLVKIFSIIRQKNLFFLIVAPSFFRLNSYFALDRTKFLVRTYLKGNRRGQLAYYGEKKKAKLYRTGKKEHNYDAVRPNFRTVFSKCWLLENQQYKRIKEQTLNAAFKIAEQPKVRSPTQIIREYRDEVIRRGKRLKISSTITSGLLDIHDSRVRQVALAQ